MSTNITDQHKNVFEAMTSGNYRNFALFSCFVNGEPATAIVVVTKEDDEYQVTPVFVSLTDGMTITDHEGVPA